MNVIFLNFTLAARCCRFLLCNYVIIALAKLKFMSNYERQSFLQSSFFFRVNKRKLTESFANRLFLNLPLNLSIKKGLLAATMTDGRQAKSEEGYDLLLVLLPCVFMCLLVIRCVDPSNIREIEQQVKARLPFRRCLFLHPSSTSRARSIVNKRKRLGISIHSPLYYS
jgi:hypothetical protein